MSVDGPVYFGLTRREAQHIVNVVLTNAHDIRESDPVQATDDTQLAHRLQRHIFAVRPLAYRPGPVDVVVEYDNVGALVAGYHGDDAA